MEREADQRFEPVFACLKTATATYRERLEVRYAKGRV